MFNNQSKRISSLCLLAVMAVSLSNATPPVPTLAVTSHTVTAPQPLSGHFTWTELLANGLGGAVGGGAGGAVICCAGGAGAGAVAGGVAGVVGNAARQLLTGLIVQRAHLPSTAVD